MKLGTAFQTNILIHHSWLWLLPLVVATLIFRQGEPPVEAIVMGLLMFGSVLLATLARVYVARRSGAVWPDVLLFPVGAVVRRERCSTLRQERRIASAELAVYALLALLFGVLGIGMQIIALFNAGLLLFTFLLRLSPHHDNLLYALLATMLSKKTARQIMQTLTSLVISIFSVAGIALIVVSWWAFGLWFTVALMGSQLIESAEKMGEFREEIAEEAVTTVVNRSSAPSTSN